ncbi:EAL domain-containing protein [Desulfoplanes formicivorans]|uniref:Diguanylate cyclase n=1 Tax=Desulfoplanes formicivorans TaxID=1592317 RepID=A0A194AHG1_9BACT|nr:EAL domain-containing protein [Desulfoplanes formicivorans]GAU08645.1 diguanylate cyclase [Desulfoplanes formicivorans]
MDSPQHLFPPVPPAIKGSPFDMAFVIDRQGICLDILALDPDLVLQKTFTKGTSLAEVLPPQIGQLLPEMIQQSLTKNIPHRVEFPLTHAATGSEHWFVARCLLLPCSVHAKPRFLWYGRDNTAHKIRETELTMYRDHLEEMVKLRTQEQRRTNEELRKEIDRHKLTSKALTLARERYDLAIRGAKDGIWDWDLTNDSVYLSPQWKESLGFADHEISNDIWEWATRIQKDDYEKMLENFGRILRSNESNFANEYRMYHKDGSIRWIYIKGAVLRDSEGKAVRMAGTCTDITGRKHAENISSMLLQIANAINTTVDLEELYASIHKILLTFIEAKNFCIALVDPKKDRLVFPYFRDEIEQQFTELEHFSANTQGGIVKVVKSGRTLVLTTKHQIDSHGIGMPAKIWIGVPLKSRDKVIGAMAVQHYIWPDHDTAQDVQILEAVSSQIALAIERKANEKLLSHLAMHDSLTHLPNRILLRERVGQALRRVQRNKDYHFALAMIDLDRFKFVNDCHGHHVGDALLQKMATRIHRSLRSIDTLARLGGDEFAILFEEIGTSHKLIHKIKKIQAIIQKPFSIKGYDVQIDSSIGLILKTGSYSTVDDLLRDADTAMYQAKSMGPGKIRVFSKSMHRQNMITMSLEQDLRQALTRDEFFLEYQPVVNFVTMDVEGFEALLRWRHPTRGLISPNQFIPIAEDTGLIREIGLWAMEQACSTLATWHREIPSSRRMTMAVNLSAKQLNVLGLSKKIRQIMDASGITPSVLNIEITETAIMEAPKSALAALKQIKALGVGVALDDFGTGYSSLSYLHNFPTDTIKIDRSFVAAIQNDEESLEIVRAIVILGNSLSLKVIAEGIETWKQYETLKNMGCDQAQGFLFSHPLGETICRELLEHPETIPWKHAIPHLDP